MRRFLRRQIPSMFHRRLLLLAFVGGATILTLTVQSARLTLGADARWALRDAERVLVVPHVVPTVRGRILDRRGRVLAVDEPGWDIAVKYSVITGEWAFDQAKAIAKNAHKQDWTELAAQQREDLIAEYRQPFDEQMEILWQRLAGLGGVDRDELEQSKTNIVRRVHNEASYLWAVWRQQRRRELEEDVDLPQVADPIEEQHQAHSVLTDVGDEVRLAVQSLIREAEENKAIASSDAVNPMKVWLQVEILRPKHRRYPLETITKMIDRSHLPTSLRRRGSAEVEVTVEGVGTHIIGLMRKTFKEDEQTRPFDLKVDRGGYRVGDRIGKCGVERSMEDHLRGVRGHDIYHRDTKEKLRLALPIPGRDVQLTIDIHLQARIGAIMSPSLGLMQVQPWHQSSASEQGHVGRPLNGAAVVLEVDSGEVLAAVSVPAMPLRLIRENHGAIYKDPYNVPYLNRAVASRYPPGSTIKPVLLVSAVSSGVHHLNRQIECRIALDPSTPTKYRCWYFRKYMRTHHFVDGPMSIEVSCNIYYYTLGLRMGVNRLVEWYGKFGLGASTDCGLMEEVAGDLPDPASASRQSAILMGIGQGPIGWTPLQAAAAYATLARGGVYVPPTFIAQPAGARQERSIDLSIDAAAIQEAMKGLRLVLMGSRGTARSLEGEPIIDIEGVRVYGKSGTADPGKRRWVDLNLNDKRDKGEFVPVLGDHAWFVVMVQPDGQQRPTHVVVVVMEYGGSGSKVAGPVANQILFALRQEGYLP